MSRTHSCAVYGCREVASGFICPLHWAQLPDDLRKSILAAHHELRLAEKVADENPMHRACRHVANAKGTTYRMLKNQAAALLTPSPKSAKPAQP